MTMPLRRTPLKSGQPPVRKARLRARNWERWKRNWARANHSEARVRWVRRRRCKVPGCCRWAENMHIRTGGTGRKADYTDIADICRTHHRESHRGVKTFEKKHGICLRRIADALQRDWERVEKKIMEVGG